MGLTKSNSFWTSHHSKLNDFLSSDALLSFSKVYGPTYLHLYRNAHKAYMLFGHTIIYNIYCNAWRINTGSWLTFSSTTRIWFHKSIWFSLPDWRCWAIASIRSKIDKSLDILPVGSGSIRWNQQLGCERFVLSLKKYKLGMDATKISFCSWIKINI